MRDFVDAQFIPCKEQNLSENLLCVAEVNCFANVLNIFNKDFITIHLAVLRF